MTYYTSGANRVIAHFRKQRTPLIPTPAHARGFLNGIDRLWSEGFSLAEIDHARRVLIRLIRFAGRAS